MPQFVLSGTLTLKESLMPLLRDTGALTISTGDWDVSCHYALGAYRGMLLTL